MTDGIGRIGSSNYGLGGSFYRANKDVKAEQKAQPQSAQPEVNELDPNKVLDLLSQQASNIFIPVAKSEKVSVNVPKQLQDRIASSMQEFENVFAIAKGEVGEDLALEVLDLMSEKAVSNVK